MPGTVQSAGTADVIVGTDVIFSKALVLPLLSTLRAFSKPGPYRLLSEGLSSHCMFARRVPS